MEKDIKIPETLAEAVNEVINRIAPEELEEFKFGKFTLPQLHMSFGMWLRNNWGLWSGSKLRDVFFDLGIYHADDMSGIILDAAQNKLEGKDFNLTEQVNHYRKYWADRGIACDQEIKKLRSRK